MTPYAFKSVIVIKIIPSDRTVRRNRIRSQTILTIITRHRLGSSLSELSNMNANKIKKKYKILLLINNKIYFIYFIYWTL